MNLAAPAMGPAEATKSRSYSAPVARAFSVATLATLIGFVPHSSIALSQRQLTEVTELCSAQYTGFSDAHQAFTQAGWSHLLKAQTEGVMVNLAMLQIMDRAHFQYRFNTRGMATKIAETLTGESGEVWIVDTAFKNIPLLQATTRELLAEQAEVFTAPDDALVAVRVSFDNQSLRSWRQYCDVLSADSILAQSSLQANFPDNDDLDIAQDVLATQARYQLRPLNPAPTAAVPIATALLFNKRDFAPEDDLGLQAQVWINIGIAVREPTDLTPIEVNP